MLNRNPWTGISAWREFCYDLRHPVLFHRRAVDGIMGRNGISIEERVVGIGLIAVGLACFSLGLVMLVLG